MEMEHILAAAATSTLSWSQTLAVISVIAGALLLIGVLVIVARRSLGGKDPSQSVVRSWLALILVAGLVLFCAVTFAINDPNLRSTIFGGLTASVGSAVAFYFSSKSSDQARQDILNATFGTETVPSLTGSTENEAAALLGKSSLKLEVNPSSSNVAGAKVETQQPPKDSVVRKGTSITVTLSPPGAPAAEPPLSQPPPAEPPPPGAPAAEPPLSQPPPAEPPPPGAPAAEPPLSQPPPAEPPQAPESAE
jgi:PASTA domain